MKIRYPQSINLETFDLVSHGKTHDLAVVESLVLTSEICGHGLSRAAAKLLASDLAGFDEAVVLRALARCRLELQGPLKVADILVRIDDGRPSPDEAWAMMPQSEMASVVWTDEMAKAWGNALTLLDAGDVTGARHAFDDTYEKAVLDARIQKKPVHWMPSLGIDVVSRRAVLLDAVKKGRLSAAHVQQLLPAESPPAVTEEATAQLNIWKLH